MASPGPPTVYDFILPSGDSATINVTVVDSVDVAVDITGMTFKWSAGKLNEPSTLIDLTIGSGLTIIDAVNGRIDIAISKSTILLLGIWRHELEVISGATSQTVLEGEITVTKTHNPLT